MSALNVKIAQSASKPECVEIMVENQTSEPISALKWNSILDDVPTDILSLSLDGVGDAPYAGPAYKRIFDPIHSIQSIPSGGSYSYLFDVVVNYRIPAVGRYVLKLKDKNFHATDGNQIAILGNEIDFYVGAPLLQRDFEDIPSMLHGEVISVENMDKPAVPVCPPNPGPLCTMGTYEDGVCYKTFFLTHPLRGPQINEQQRQILNRAYEIVYTKLLDHRIQDDGRFRKWFGDFRLYPKVGAVIAGIFSQRICKAHKLYGEVGGCSSDTVASFTRPPDSKSFGILNLCPKFWSLPLTGIDSQAGTIVHELTHGYGGTVDHKYGVNACLQLAKENPAFAIENADSYEYYLEEYFGFLE